MRSGHSLIRQLADGVATPKHTEFADHGAYHLSLRHVLGLRRASYDYGFVGALADGVCHDAVETQA